MGLIKMVAGSVSGNLKDQVRELFECDNMSNNILGTPATKRLRNGTVNNATDDVISNGSQFNVGANQAAIFIENGKVHDYVIGTDEDTTGPFIYNSSAEPSLLGGGFKDFLPSAKNMLERFTFGGQSRNVMRLYYINCKNITNIPVGFGNITFRDGETGVNVKAQAHGKFEFQIVNPVAFYENYVQSYSKTYSIESGDGANLISQMKADMGPEFTAALGELSAQNVYYEQLVGKSKEICEIMNRNLKESWLNDCGIMLTKLNLMITFDDESVKEILEIQKLKNYQSDAMLRAKMGVGMTEAANTAAGNTAGAMTGFMGMGMTGAMMGQQMGNFGFQGGMGQQAYDPNAQARPNVSFAGAATAAPQQAPQQEAAPQMQAPSQAAADSWTCTCGATNTGKFCAECGTAKPEPVVAEGWTCKCGNVNKGKFCAECGSPKPAGAPLYKCDKCGWEPEDPKNPPKFCPQCGDKFDENDVQ